MFEVYQFTVMTLSIMFEVYLFTVTVAWNSRVHKHSFSVVRCSKPLMKDIQDSIGWFQIRYGFTIAPIQLCKQTKVPSLDWHSSQYSSTYERKKYNKGWCEKHCVILTEMPK